MGQFFKSPKKLAKSSLAVFFLAVILFWLKTYIAYRIEFNLGINNDVQRFLLFLNPLSSTLVFLGFALFFKGKIQSGMLIGLNFFLSFLLYANVVYYRFFNDFITVPVLMQAKVNGGQRSFFNVSFRYLLFYRYPFTDFSCDKEMVQTWKES
jgi:lipoteichoic acid synthase